MPDASPLSSRLVITVHGIRTFGHWQERLEKLLLGGLNPSARKLDVFHYKYGYFSAFAFLSGILRWLAVRRFRKALISAARADPARVDIIAHSFGTYLAAHALRGLDTAAFPKVHTLILAGSVLPAHFDWSDLVPARVERVVNDCGSRDNILLLSQALPFLGMAGRVGFRGLLGARLRNRFFKHGHSGYFLNAEGKSDSFMRERWLPLLSVESPVEPFDERPDAWHQGIEAFLLNNARPAKIAIYVAIVFFAIAYGLPALAEQYAIRSISEDEGVVSEYDGGTNVVYLHGAEPKDSIPWIASLRNIRKLDFAGADIDDQEVAMLPPLEGLVDLNLDGTKISSQSLPRLAQYENLERLSLSGLSLGEEASIPAFKALTYLQLDDSRVSHSAFASIGKLTSLQGLSLMGTPVTPTDLAQLGALKNLENIYLDRSELTDEIIASFPNLPKLRFLDMEKNPGVTGATFHSLSKLSQLEELYINETAVSNEALAHIAKLSKLKVLVVHTTNLEAGAIELLCSLPLQQLFIGGTGITDDDVALLGDSKTLEVFWARNTRQVTMRGIRPLLSVPTLKTLGVEGTGLTGDDMEEIRRVRPDVALPKKK